MTCDMLIRNIRLVERGGEHCDIAVQGESVIDVGCGLTYAAREEIDGERLVAFPGLVDAHVHFNDPGRDSWEGGTTGSRALAAGGATCFVDMPLNSSPPTLTRAAFLAKRERLEAQSVIDFALWGGLTPSSLGNLEELAACGVVGFKAFMCPSGIDDFEHCDDLTLLRGMERAAALGLPVAVHAESAALTGALTAAIRERGGEDARSFFASRPVVAELEAIDRALLYAEETGCAVHIVHVSTARGIDRVRRAVDSGAVDGTCETCPHYLLLNEDDAERIGPRAKCAPPLRSEEERRSLLAAVERGEVDTIGSDHSPSPPDMKDGKSFMNAWGGIAGGQSTLRALLSLGIPCPAIAELAAGRPAERLGLVRKGRIQPGYDADITLVDDADGADGDALTRDELWDRHRASPYVGMRFSGRVRRVILRGATAYHDGTWARTTGRFIARELPITN